MNNKQQLGLTQLICSLNKILMTCRGYSWQCLNPEIIKSYDTGVWRAFLDLSSSALELILVLLDSHGEQPQSPASRMITLPVPVVALGHAPLLYMALTAFSLLNNADPSRCSLGVNSEFHKQLYEVILLHFSLSVISPLLSSSLGLLFSVLSLEVWS